MITQCNMNTAHYGSKAIYMTHRSDNTNDLCLYTNTCTHIVVYCTWLVVYSNLIVYGRVGYSNTRSDTALSWHEAFRWCDNAFLWIHTCGCTCTCTVHKVFWDMLTFQHTAHKIEWFNHEHCQISFKKKNSRRNYIQYNSTLHTHDLYSILYCILSDCACACIQTISWTLSKETKQKDSFITLLLHVHIIATLLVQE